ncbi:class III lanthipeptide [Luteimonas sp. Y-2-2-4F]|nr:class III lanthipeptide [Luteimonas sp. Y-2-2-4F]MCD9030382.1 class III lanthipeptide [Luteimonas sp. Y-2-2-4F]
MNAVLSLQALELDIAAEAGNSGASVNCTSGSSVSNHCGGHSDQLEKF